VVVVRDVVVAVMKSVGMGVAGRMELCAVCMTATTIAMTAATPSTPAATAAPVV
jgi:hypothetical protein